MLQRKLWPEIHLKKLQLRIFFLCAQILTTTWTRPSVNYAKDWLDQLLLFPGLEKDFTYGCGRWGQLTTILLSIAPFSAWWRTITTNRLILVQACSWPVWKGSLLQYICNDLWKFCKPCYVHVLIVPFVRFNVTCIRVSFVIFWGISILIWVCVEHVIIKMQ